MDMSLKGKKIEFAGKKEPGAKAAHRGFFSRMLEPFRAKTPEELLKRGNALRAEAKINLQEKGDMPEALEERLSIYRAALANFDKARNAARKTGANDLKREIRASRAVCHLAMGSIYEKLGTKQKAREHYMKTTNIACAQLLDRDPFDEMTREAGKNSDACLERVWRG